MRWYSKRKLLYNHKIYFTRPSFELKKKNYNILFKTYPYQNIHVNRIVVTQIIYTSINTLTLFKFYIPFLEISTTLKYFMKLSANLKRNDF